MSHIAIISTGVIGTGWVARLLANGFDVRVWDPSPDFGARLGRDMDRLWPRIEQHGLSKGASTDNLSIAASIEDACDGATFVQESAPERLDLKQSLHAQIDAATAPHVVIASSSSGLLPSDIQTSMGHPDRFLIGHPFNPVYLLPLVELVGGQATGADTIERARMFYEGIGMRPLTVRREIEGYLSDRLQEALWREILHLVNDGVADTSELDDAIVYGPGLRWALMGTCLTFHLAGGEAGMRHMLEQFGPALELPWTKLEAPALNETLIDRMVEGTARQAGAASVAELESLRDEFLIELLTLVERYRGRLDAARDGRK